MMCVNLMPLPAHLRSWRGSPTRCHRPGTAGCWCPGGHSPAGSVCRRPRQSGCCRRSGRRSRFLVEPAVGSAPLGRQRGGDGHGRGSTSRHSLFIQPLLYNSLTNTIHGFGSFLPATHDRSRHAAMLRGRRRVRIVCFLHAGCGHTSRNTN